jgi:hypothetical protein
MIIRATTAAGAPTPKPTPIPWLILGRDVRVVRRIEKFSYEFVTIDALSRGGVLRVWKTTQ